MSEVDLTKTNILHSIDGAMDFKDPQCNTVLCIHSLLLEQWNPPVLTIGFVIDGRSYLVIES